MTKHLVPALLVAVVAVCWLLLIAGMKSADTPDLQYVPVPQPAPVIPIVVP